MKIIHEEQPTEGLLYQIFDNGIHRLLLTKTTRKVVDAVVEKAMSIDETCHAAHEHACFLYVLDNVSFTPYLLHKVVQAVQSTPSDLRESTAVVGNNFTINIVRSLIIPRVAIKARQSTQFFTDEQDALEWLTQRIKALADM